MRLEDLPNLGPKSAQWLREIDISSLEQIRELGPVKIQLILKDRGYKVSLNMLWALAGVVYDMSWKDLPPDLKASLLVELDAMEDARKRYLLDAKQATAKG